MENTLDNKARFFALYYGQKVLCIRKSNEPKLHVGFDDFTPKEKLQTDYLELKPLSSITHKDAIAVYRKVLYNEGHHNHYKLKIQDEIKQGKDCALSCLYLKGGYCGFGAGTGEWVSSYLRSKGYALPFMGLSVEKMIEYNWIKLTL
jgi:hypothetical protein